MRDDRFDAIYCSFDLILSCLKFIKHLSNSKGAFDIPICFYQIFYCPALIYMKVKFNQKQ